MEVDDWFTDNALYCLPDGTIVRAVLDERDDAFRWILADLQGQRLFIFMDDGRVYAYVRERILYPTAANRSGETYTSVWMVPCDLMVEDLHPYVPTSHVHR